MRYFTTASFQSEKYDLCKKRKNNYSSLPEDICENLTKTTTYETILQISDVVSKVDEGDTKIIVKTRYKNTAMGVGQSGGFRTIGVLDQKRDSLTFIMVYAKKGALEKKQPTRQELINAMNQYKDQLTRGTLIEVDIDDDLKIIPPAEKLEDEVVAAE